MTEAECQVETIKHIENVRKYIKFVIFELMQRSEEHDLQKLQSPELELFTEYTPKLAATTYGSEEYKECLQGLSEALEHHYSHCRHHPEHFENGINGMNLIDLIEMICDWKAAAMRHNDGDIKRSIEINAKRFGYGDQLKSIFLNTANALDELS